MTLREVCMEHGGLPPEELQRLEALEQGLEVTAELTAADVFIDLFDREGMAWVAAQASPSVEGSSYRERVVGRSALRENEPAVYRALESGVTVRDLKAVTQENKTVRQDVAPLKNAAGQVIAVLISERDVTGDLSREKKYRELMREKEEQSPARTLTAADAAMREVHHRVKNNLQMVASIMNLQARRTENAEVRRAFRENTARVQSISAIHDLLTHAEDSAAVELMPLLEKIRRSIQSIFRESRLVEIRIEGEDMSVPPDRATSIALVVNELLSNALEHGFREGESGLIRIQLCPGALFSVITVEDNGMGFDAAARCADSLGLSIVTLVVKEKLGGDLRILSDENGTRASFDFCL
ncbi:MAG: sensor histidine kinase [Oscillospiraceae bacterium]|nr:sensor histidine kinase [Oscillospiraceae bacterium]